MKFRTRFMVLTFLTCSGVCAHAADVETSQSAPAATEAQPASNYGALIIGLGATSNYIVGGLTQTNNKLAIQPFIEYDSPFGVYGGVWGSNVDFGPFVPDTWEIDGYIGYRNTFDKLSVDVNYWRYYYNDSGYYGDAIFAGADYALTDQWKAGGQVKFDFALNDQIYTARSSFNLDESWSIGGKVEFSRDTDARDWDIGITKKFNEAISADLRYYDTNFDKPKVVFSLTTALNVLALAAK